LPGSRRGAYGSIDGLARSKCGASIGNRFERRADGRRLAIDYAAAADSFGYRGRRADDRVALRAALAEARAGDVTTVIHCPTAPDRPLLGSGAFWDLGVPEVARDPDVERLHAEHDQQRSSLQRYY
jgi:3D-(3,5/4)-trihydroxycyclohexane-1,2-dione acylhydrolase (decyclizing)